MPQSLMQYVPIILNAFFSVVVIVVTWIVYRVTTWLSRPYPSSGGTITKSTKTRYTP